MAKLSKYDLIFGVRRLPKKLIALMKEEKWSNQIYIGGGYLRSIVAGERINDIDVFTSSKEKAKELADLLAEENKSKIYETDNALSVKGFNVMIQIIHRWVFPTPESVADSFDFTICCAVISCTTTVKYETTDVTGAKKKIYDHKWDSYCDETFYQDLASKRLIYRSPKRNEDAGGSILRVLKYYQKGYRIPLDSFGLVIARLIKDIKFECINNRNQNEEETAKIITGLLREVDPLIDPTHAAHLESALSLNKDEESLSQTNDTEESIV